MRERFGTGALIYLAIGGVIAATHNFLNSAHLTSLSGLLSAVLAVMAWPLLVLGIHISI